MWIELGLPDERRIKKACTRAAKVALFTYNSRAAQIWWQQNQSKFVQFANLSVWYLDDEQLAKVSAFADRTMTLQATIQDGVIWLSDDKNNLEVNLTAATTFMIVISRHVAIPDGELEITAIRAQGAGGQHVNKTSTAIHLRFDIRASSLPEYYKERLLAASHHLISSDGVIVIKAQEYRSQELNREAALARLVAVIKDLTTEQKPDDPRGPPVHRKSAGWHRKHKNQA